MDVVGGRESLQDDVARETQQACAQVAGSAGLLVQGDPNGGREFLAHCFEDCGEDRLLIAKMVVDSSLRDSGSRGNRIDAGELVALAHEQLAGGFQHGAALLDRAATLPSAGVRRSHAQTLPTVLDRIRS